MATGDAILRRSKTTYNFERIQNDLFWNGGSIYICMVLRTTPPPICVLDELTSSGYLAYLMKELIAS